MPNFLRHIQIGHGSLHWAWTAAVSKTSRSSVRHSVGKWLTMLGGILVVGMLAISCALKPKSTLVVGMELNYPPFEMIDTQRKPTGISVEMANELGKFLDKKVQIQNIPFDGLIPALKTGKIDLIISSMTETPERAKSIDFSDPYLRTGLCLLVNKNAPIESIDQADNPNISVAVKQGTTGQLYAQQHLKRAHILVLDKPEECVLEVVQNKAQAFIYDQMSVFKHWQQHQDSTKAILKPFQEERWAVGIRSDDQALKAQVNAFLVVFKRNGGFEKLGDKYLKEQKEQFRNLGIPFYF
jgi:polar amino acid transport system substrate-binding protein